MTDEDKATYLYQMRFMQFLFERHGEAALADIRDHEQAKMERIWKDLGRQQGNSIEKLVELLWLGMGGDFEYRVEKLGEDDYQLRCTKCPFVALARDNGMAEVGFQKFCMSDYGIVKGFNERILFTRTKTLMEGHDCCDHRYRLKPLA